MQGLFQRRSRKELKRKFYREEKVHPELVKAALNAKSKLPLDLAPFEACLGKINDRVQQTDETAAIPVYNTDTNNSALNDAYVVIV